MRLDWYTLQDHRGYNAGTSVLWSEHGFYQWINDEQRVIIAFYPRPGMRREVVRVGIFAGPNWIEAAENAVEQDMMTRSGYWLSVREECEDLIRKAIAT